MYISESYENKKLLEEEGDMEHIVTESLIGGAKLIGSFIGTVNKILDHED